MRGLLSVFEPHLSFTSPSGYGLNERRKTKNEKWSGVKLRFDPRPLFLFIRRRSQRGSGNWTWSRMQRLARLHLPRPRVIHPYPNQRFRARLKAGAV